MRRLASVLHGVELLAWALWLGGIVALAIAAPALFQTIDSRDVAGRAFGAMLARLFPLMYACAAALLLAGVVGIAVTRRVGWVEVARYGLVVVMLGLAAYAGTVVLTEMQTLQASLPAPIETLPLESDARMRFDRLHKLSERLVGLDALLGIALLPLLMVRRSAQGQPVEHHVVARVPRTDHR